jgi:cell division septal protein FtsQ
MSDRRFSEHKKEFDRKFAQHEKNFERAEKFAIAWFFIVAIAAFGLIGFGIWVVIMIMRFFGII